MRIRWMIVRDMPEVLQIEQQKSIPWSEQDFLRVLRNRNTIGFVAVEEYNEKIRGFLICMLQPDNFNVENFAIDPDYPEAADLLINRLKSRTVSSKRSSITVSPKAMNRYHSTWQRNGFSQGVFGLVLPAKWTI